MANRAQDIRRGAVEQLGTHGDASGLLDGERDRIGRRVVVRTHADIVSNRVCITGRAGAPSRSCPARIRRRCLPI